MIKIIADSGCDFTEDMRNQKNINIEQVPLNLQIDKKQYIDNLNLDTKKFIDDMLNFKGVPKTAAPSPELYMEKFKGAESNFVVTLSSQLSGSYNSAEIAKNMYLEENKDKFIHIIDSMSASAGETLICLKINEMIKLNYDENKIKEKIADFVSEMNTYFILERYDNLIKTGRLNPYVAKIASLLSIIPICGADNGKTVLKGQARGNKKAFSKLIEMMQKEGKDFENKTLTITHVNCLEKAMELKNEILKKISFKDIIMSQASGLCSTYADNHGLIIAF